MLKFLRRFKFYFAVASVAFWAAVVNAAISVETAPEVGKLAPAFSLKDINGKKVSVSDLRGKVVLLNFWATTCGPCKTEMPSMSRLYTELRDRGFVVLAVTIDTSEKAVMSFVSAAGVSFPVLLDKDKDVYFDDYAVLGLPTTFLIDKNGIIAEKFVGERDWDSPSIKNKIISLLDRRQQ